jgi:hypothetical protein
MPRAMPNPHVLPVMFVTAPPSYVIINSVFKGKPISFLLGKRMIIAFHGMVNTLLPCMVGTNVTFVGIVVRDYITLHT